MKSVIKKILLIPVAIVFFGLCLIVIVDEFSGTVASEDAPPELLESYLLVRQGIDDLGGITVGEFVSVIESKQDVNGDPIQVDGWWSEPPIYQLYLTAAGSEVIMELSFDKPRNSSVITAVEGDGQAYPPMVFIRDVYSRPDVVEPPS